MAGEIDQDVSIASTRGSMQITNEVNSNIEVSLCYFVL